LESLPVPPDDEADEAKTAPGKAAAEETDQAAETVKSADGDDAPDPKVEAKRQAQQRKKEQEQALRRAVELAPRVRKELGQAWLDESFTERIERGREVLVTLGSVVASGPQSHPTDAEFRLKSLELATTAVDALLRAAPQTAAAWQDASRRPRSPITSTSDRWGKPGVAIVTGTSTTSTTK
jgi:hypothetical protein